MPLELSLREPQSIPVEVETVSTDVVRDLTLDDVSRLTVFQGNTSPTLGDLFDVRGSAVDDQTIVWQGDCAKVKAIGAGQSAGRVVVEGDAGMHVGARMSGGEIEVRGNAADWVGAELRGGLIRVSGNAGHLVGAVYRGGRRGMRGGVILVEGNAGNEIGHTMRRGVIAVRGRTGDALGFNMIAGTVLTFGETGIRPGAGMRRGSLVFAGDRPALLPTFKLAGREQPAFLPIYLRRLRELGFAVEDDWLTAEFDRHVGDFLELGKGEVLVRAAA